MNKHVNKVIQRAIKIAGGTQGALAKKAGVSQNAIWKLLTGSTKQPSYTTSVKLEEAVGNEISRIEFMESRAVRAEDSGSEQLDIIKDTPVCTNNSTEGHAA